jgi:tripartite-type tricarboxylate transporter receptor subunit TctC
MVRKTWAACAAMALYSVCAWAAPYPERPVTLIVPFAAGGDADLAGRNLAATAQRLLGQPVVVLDKAGASGAIGSMAVRDAAPDGYTLLVARVGSQAVLPALKPDLGFKWDDFTFLGLLELNPFVCFVSADSPYRTFGDLTNAIKANPGKLNYSSSGAGTILHLAPLMIFQSLGLDENAAVHVAYKGGSEAALAVISKNVDFSCGNLTSTLGLIRGGKVRALVTTTPERVSDIPDVPTARESGFPELEAIIGWSALYGPPRMPKEIVARWAEVLAATAKDPAWLAGEQKIGSIPRVLSPDETRRYVEGQVRTYEKLGRQLHLELH